MKTFTKTQLFNIIYAMLGEDLGIYKLKTMHISDDKDDSLMIFILRVENFDYEVQISNTNNHTYIDWIVYEFDKDLNLVNRDSLYDDIAPHFEERFPNGYKLIQKHSVSITFE